MSEIPKAYEPTAVEEKWYQFWLDQKCFVADPARVSAKRPAYSIVIPPPNVTGVLTMGHVLNNTIQDILARKARMDGKEVLWLPGTDHAGIATQTVVEKTLRKQGVIKHRDDLGREKFLEHVWTWKEKHGGIIIQQLKKLGASCDWTRERFTMDPDYSRCVQKVFVDLYKKGLIYRGKRMVNWDPAARTALSDEEVNMVEEKGHLWHIKYPVLDDQGQPKAHEAVVVATTRPETMLGDEAVAVNPKDERYTHLVGKKLLLPLQNKPIPVIADELVDPKFGTGCVKVTPAHDKADYEMAVRHNLPFTVIIASDGTMTDLAGEEFAGMDRLECRAAVVEDLQEQGFLVKIEDYVHNVGYSERSHVPIEPYLSEQWFLKYPSVEKAIECVAGSAGASPAAGGALADVWEREDASDGASAAAPEAGALPLMRFHPDRWAKTYTHWMANIRDWCISRQLWWGHRVPVWYNQAWLRAKDKSVPIVVLPDRQLTRPSVRQLRKAAWENVRKAGIIRNRFINDDTGWPIFVSRKSIEHGFSNHGLANIFVVTELPELIRTAVHVATMEHEPKVPQFQKIHLFFAALTIGNTLYRVKLTVKERPTGELWVTSQRLELYDHKTQLLKENETDGESPGTHPLSEKLVTRPTSASQVKVAELAGDVNRDFNLMQCCVDSPGPDWNQDPDVLDTWFSSWLWPFATMGWPEQTETLKKFYPTTDLVTGPDIIFFWVARMIMAGYEFMGDLPFRNVYFTGIIRDKLGRKMSKSLGNSPDPLDLIAKYGADALRFGTMRSAPLGQDILFDEQNVELGRNFCNKLWNACRFRQMQGSAGGSPANEGGSPEQFEVQGEIDPALLTSDDKWVLLRLDQAIREIDAAFTEYKFSDAAATLYRFFWSEYCDWYVEASKADLYGSDVARKANKLAVIDFVLSHTLRLFHPFLPFITEELWHGLGFSTDMPEDQGGRTIMVARWPKPLSDDEKSFYSLDPTAEQLANAKYELVGKGRNLRREFNIPSSKKIKFVLKPAGALSAHEVEVIKNLLNAESIELDATCEAPKGTPSALSPLGEIFLPLGGLIDVAAEKARLTKELAKANTEIEKVQQKLNNPAFVQKVPPHVLADHQNRLAEWQAKQQHAQSALNALAEQ